VTCFINNKIQKYNEEKHKKRTGFFDIQFDMTYQLIVMFKSTRKYISECTATSQHIHYLITH